MKSATKRTNNKSPKSAGDESPAKPRTIVAVTEQVMCPNPDCDTRLGAHDYTSSPITEHPERNTMRREIKTHCPACDRRYQAELFLSGGQWLIESLVETPKSNRGRAA